MIKKILLSALCFLPLNLLAGPLRVVTTTTDFAAIVSALGGDHVRVEALARGDQNPHFVDAKPSLIVKLMDADLFIQNGMELEIGWAFPLLQGARNPKLAPGQNGFVDASQFITPLDVPTQVDRSMGDVHPQGNPHYMADPQNARLVAEGLTARLILLRPQAAKDFEKNRDEFLEKLFHKKEEWQNSLKPFAGTPFVSYHRDFSYFASRFGFVSVGEIEPKPGIPPSASHTARLIDTMKENKVPLIITSPWYERRTPDAIARATGAEVVTFAFYPQNGGKTQDYFIMMDRNITLILEALQKRNP